MNRIAAAWPDASGADAEEGAESLAKGGVKRPEQALWKMRLKSNELLELIIHYDLI